MWKPFNSQSNSLLLWISAAYILEGYEIKSFLHVYCALAALSQVINMQFGTRESCWTCVFPINPCNSSQNAFLWEYILFCCVCRKNRHQTISGKSSWLHVRREKYIATKRTNQINTKQLKHWLITLNCCPDYTITITSQISYELYDTDYINLIGHYSITFVPTGFSTSSQFAHKEAKVELRAVKTVKKKEEVIYPAIWNCEIFRFCSPTPAPLSAGSRGSREEWRRASCSPQCAAALRRCYQELTAAG